MATVGNLLQAFQLVVLVTLLFPEPGNSQYAVNLGRCGSKSESCPSVGLFKEYVKRIVKFEKCPDNVLFKFVLPRKAIYGKASEGWVQDLAACLENDKNKNICLSSPDSGYKNQCPTVKPITTTTTTTTTSSTTTTTTTATTRATTKSFEEHPVVTTRKAPNVSTTPENREVTTKKQEFNQQEAINLQKGSEGQQGPGAKSSEPEGGQKAKTMTIAVISLIVICLVLVSILTGVFCRRKKMKGYQRPPMDESM